MQKWIMRAAVPMTLATMMAGCGSQEGGQQQGIPWWLWLLLLIIVIVIAWFLWRGRGDDMNATPAPGVKREPESLDIKAEDKTPAEVVEPIVAETTQEIAPVEEEDDVADEPVVDVATTPDQPDDLRVIEGIGPKIASVLNDAGIFTFAALAASDPETLRQILDDAGISRISDPTTWPDQAKFAVAGDWDGLDGLQSSLKGGRKV